LLINVKKINDIVNAIIINHTLLINVKKINEITHFNVAPHCIFY